MSLQAEQIDAIEREMMKIRSLTDVFVTVDPSELERHTLACPGGDDPRGRRTNRAVH